MSKEEQKKAAQHHVLYVDTSSNRNSLKNSPSFPNRNLNASLASLDGGFTAATLPGPGPPPAAAVAGAAKVVVASADPVCWVGDVLSPLAWNDSSA